MRSTHPFAAFEWHIAWRYLRARRREGGISAMTLISLLGIAIAVFALVATLSIRSGYRTQFVATVLGANAHASILSEAYLDADGRLSDRLQDYREIADSLLAVEGVERVAPVVKTQLLAQSPLRNAGVELVGMALEDARRVPLFADPETKQGDLNDFNQGVSLGIGVARALGVSIGDEINLISPEGARTAFGIAPRIKSYRVVYIFEIGRYDIDRVRLYLPLAEAQSLLDREGGADEVEVYVDDAERIDALVPNLLHAAGAGTFVWTWKDSSGAFLDALQVEDNVMFIVMSILVLIAASNIVSGLVMLVKNKGRDIGILRTMGLSQGSIMRVFFLCGALTGTVGTALGLVAGCVFAINIDPIFEVVNMLAGGGVWDPSVRFLSRLPAELHASDVAAAAALSIGLSFTVTLLPARRAARMNPVEALRYE